MGWLRRAYPHHDADMLGIWNFTRLSKIISVASKQFFVFVFLGFIELVLEPTRLLGCDTLYNTLWSYFSNYKRLRNRCQLCTRNEVHYMTMSNDGRQNSNVIAHVYRVVQKKVVRQEIQCELWWQKFKRYCLKIEDDY